MSKTLTNPKHQEIFNQIKSSFSDFHLFDYLVADKLKQAIMDSDNIELNMKTTKKVAERYFDVESFKTDEQKLVWAQIQLIFKSCYVLILSKQESIKAGFWNDVDTLLSNYPMFESVDSEELNLLLNFRNMVKVTLNLVPARLNKQCILKIAGRLEGSQNEYITGGGQKPAVTRRVQIYEKEGGIVAEKRPDRVRPAKGEKSETGKRSATTFSEKKVKMVRLQSDEMRFLAKGPANPFPNMNTSSTSTTSGNHHDEFMCPLSALSVVASRMEKAPENKSTTIPVATAIDFPPLLNNSAAIGIPDLTREPSDPITSYLMSSDSDFWRETIGTMELKQPATIQRNVSLSFTMPDFSEQLTNLYPEALTTSDGKAPPTLQRGFSLGFYSTFSEDLKTLLPSSPSAK
mmetsp:Transcript_109895/g.215426  ORF Transcript_109895/g.215426 Transcript_109895/m.215426 type:complete len:403 (-) Transcript_109895:277-1485(-)